MEGYSWRIIGLLRGALRTYPPCLPLHSTNIASFYPLDPFCHCVGTPHANSTDGVCRDNWHWLGSTHWGGGGAYLAGS